MTTPAGRLAVAQRWDEHEPGWGFRPDGWSLHLDDEQRRAFLAAHADVPQGFEHDHPDGEGIDVVIDGRLEAKLADAELGLRTFDRRSAPQPRQVVREMPHAEDARGYLERLRSLAGGR